MLAARRLLARPRWQDAAGTQRNSSGGAWRMSSLTVGKRIAGTWHNASASPELPLHHLGLADAYAVESVVSFRPAWSGSILTDHYVWAAGFAPAAGRGFTPDTGACLETDNLTTGLYLIHRGVVVAQGAFIEIPTGTEWVPSPGDVVRLVMDFTTMTMSAVVNGAVASTLDVSAETWYTAEGHAV